MKQLLYRSKALSWRATTACLVAGLVAFSPAYLAAQESPAEEGSADQEQRYKRHLEAGVQAYKNKNFEKALEQLQIAYDIQPRASILFNMGLISEKKGDLEAAAGYFRQFIGAPDVGLEARKRASERLAVINEILDQQDESQGQMTNLMPALEAMNADLEEMRPASEVDSAEEEETEAAAADDEPDEAVVQEEEAQEVPEKETDVTFAADEDIDYGWGPYVAFTVGTASLVGGAVAIALYNDRVDKASNTPESALHRQYEREASDYLNLSAGMFAAGGVLIGLGTYFVVAEQAEAAKKDDDGSTSVAVGADFLGVNYSLDF